MSSKTNRVEYFIDLNDWFKSDPRWRGDSYYHTTIMNFLDDTQLSLLEKGFFENLMKLGNLNLSGNLLHCMLLSEVKCNKKNSMVFYVKESYIEFTLNVFGLVTWLSTKSSSSVLSSIREKEDGNRLLNTYFDGADKLKMGDLKNFMEIRKGEVQNDLDAKLQSTCSKKFKKILDENKSLKSELSEIKTLLLGKLKADGAILSAKQPDNPQGHTNRVVLDSDASLSLPFHGHDKLFFDIHVSAFEEKKQLAKKGKNAEGHSYEKKEVVEERVTSLGPLNIEEIKQAKNQEPLYIVIYLQTKLLFNKPSEDEARLPNKVIWASNISPTTDDFLSLRKNDNFSTSQFVKIDAQLIYVVQWDFGGTEADKDNIDETKNCGDVDSIINNVIFSVFAASSSLPTSPNVKNTQAERSELGGIKNDTTDVISEVDATTNRKKKGSKAAISNVTSKLNSMPYSMETEVKDVTPKKSVRQKFLGQLAESPYVADFDSGASQSIFYQKHPFIYDIEAFDNLSSLNTDFWAFIECGLNTSKWLVYYL
ncbi:hypothetical protein FXO38_16586 [Capsicum annuum]|nr:hypothetical protein FXO38_16586 [Capsicum annuum]